MTDEPRNVLLLEDSPDDEELTIRELVHENLTNRVDEARDGQEVDHSSGAKTRRQPPPGPSTARPQASEGRHPQTHPHGKRTHRLPVAILTSSSDHTDLVNGYDAEANSCVCKPIQFEAFAAAVAQPGAY